MATTYRLNHGLTERVEDGVPTANFVETPVAIDPPVAVPVPDTPVAFTQTYSTVATTVPNATYAAATVTGGSVPAGGTGAAAGGWDTSGHRDTAIATLAQTVTDVASLQTAQIALAADVIALKKLIGKLIDILQTAGLAA